MAAFFVAAAMIGGMAWNLAATQEQGRQTLRDDMDRRAVLTAQLITSAFMAANTPKGAQAKFSGSRASLSAAVRSQFAITRLPLAVLDARGRVLASAGASPHVNRPARSDLRVALAGSPMLSDLYTDAQGRPLVDLAVPFTTPSGRRVLVGACPAAVLRTFTDGFFRSASAVPGAGSYLLDGSGRSLGATAPEPELAAALDRRATGSHADTTFVSAAVPSSRWRVVLSAPTAGLYASVDGGPSGAAWLLFAAFTAAVMSLLGFGAVAIRSARRLAAATERERAAEALAHERLHDPLTGLPNRSLFLDRADRAIAAARRRGRSVALLFADIDQFKRINDTLGHEAGDAVLREVGRRLSDSVRPGDTVSRLGGDELVVLLEDVDADEALLHAARIQARVQEPMAVAGGSVPVSVSIGVAAGDVTSDPPTAAELMRDADAAMYRAKQLGRSRVEIFDAGLHHRALARLDAELSLRRAVENEELVVHYQPIVHLSDGTVHGAEALVRWERPDTGALVEPGEFIELAEETGLIVKIGDWVLRTAVADVGEWARRGLVGEDFELSVNVSARQLVDPSLPATVADALRGWDRPADRLCLEITETAVMLDPSLAQRTLDTLASSGVRLAIDDFGVGHSSLGQLARSMPISVLKLDRSFVAGMDTMRDRGIVAAAAAMARALDLRCVAEGVETADQAGELAAMGFVYAQGFYFGRPQPRDRFVGTGSLPVAA